MSVCHPIPSRLTYSHSLLHLHPADSSKHMLSSTPLIWPWSPTLPSPYSHCCGLTLHDSPCVTGIMIPPLILLPPPTTTSHSWSGHLYSLSTLMITCGLRSGVIFGCSAHFCLLSSLWLIGHQRLLTLFISVDLSGALLPDTDITHLDTLKQQKNETLPALDHICMGIALCKKKKGKKSEYPTEISEMTQWWWNCGVGIYTGRKSLPTGSPNCLLNSRKQRAVERKVDSLTLDVFATGVCRLLVSVKILLH